MANFEVTYSAFHDTRADLDTPAGSLIVNGEARAADLIRRMTNCGAADATARELTPEEHRAFVLARMPKTGA